MFLIPSESSPIYVEVRSRSQVSNEIRRLWEYDQQNLSNILRMSLRLGGAILRVPLFVNSVKREVSCLIPLLKSATGS